MINKIDNPELIEALADLEVSLETPFVPGELESWAQNVQTRLTDLQPLLVNQVQKVNSPLLEEIKTEDPGLLSRVENLRTRDEECLEELETLLRTIGTLNELVCELEPNETKLKTQLNDLVRQGLDFVIGVRTQLVALQTWHQEAFVRDRGVVD